MRIKAILKLAATGLAALACVSASGNWNTTVAEVDGGHRIGNPKAKVRLTEYVSYTCSHCAHFARDGDAALKYGYVGSGRVQLEVRHFVRDVVDLTAAMLTNCGAPAKFPRNHAAFMLGQEKWLPKAASATQAQQQRWFTGAAAARHRAIASDLGFYEIMSSRGYSRTQVDACLADSAMSQRLVDNTVKDAKALDIKGTPSFAINGVLLEGVHDWQSLQPRLDAKF